MHYVHVREDTDTDFRVAVRDFSDRYYVSQRSSIDSLPRALKDLAIQLAVTIHDGVKFRFKNDVVIFRRVDDKIVREDEDDKKVYKLEVDLKTRKLVFDTDFDKSCKCLMYRDEEAHSIGKFFSVFYISSEDMLPQYAADKFIDGYKRSVNL